MTSYANVTSKRAILIAGPTASGKSAMALEVAARNNGVIVNADSMQVYKELRIISARPCEADEAKTPHRLYGIVPASQRYSVGDWLKDVTVQIEDIEARGQMPVIVGGTGLYFKALLEGLARVPSLPDEIVEKWRGRVKRDGPRRMHEILRERDPSMAERLEPGDSQRIVRALTVLDFTGRSLLDWQREQTKGAVLTLDACEAIFLDTDRDRLYSRINRRFDEMIAGGGLDEVEALKKLELDPALPVMKAHGVPRLMAYLEGISSLEEATTSAKTDTRRYAKRQKTWFRTQMPGWNWQTI